LISILQITSISALHNPISRLFLLTSLISEPILAALATSTMKIPPIY
jgi:hypothetical protein